MSHHFWTRLVIVAIVITGSALLAKAVDWRIARLELEPGQATRYRVLRKAIFSGIVFVGAVSALLVIPQVRAVAGGVLASSAVIGLVIGFASQRTIGNVVAGILVAITQPLRLGDRVTVEGVEGIVEEIGLTYTWIRTPDNDRLVVPNERIASDSLRNSTIRSEQSLAEVKIQVPAAADLRGVVNSLLSEADEVYVTDLADKATIVLRKRIPLHENLPYAESELRLAAAERLKDVEAVDR
jgi:small-conductance mechanosensitive channel